MKDMIIFCDTDVLILHKAPNERCTLARVYLRHASVAARFSINMATFTQRGAHTVCITQTGLFSIWYTCDFTYLGSSSSFGCNKSFMERVY